MKKRYLTIASLLLASCGVIASCNNRPSEKEKGPATYKLLDKDLSITYKQVRTASDYHDMTDQGRTLILPIEFTDYPHTALAGEKHTVGGVEYGKEGGSREIIYNVTFGESEDTQWESLRSYYKKSSYGKANLTGAVAPWFNPWGEDRGEFFNKPLSAKGLATVSPGYNGSKYCLRQALDELYTNTWREMRKEDGSEYQSAAEFFQDFDRDGDNLIDNIQLVYTCPPHPVDDTGHAIDNELFWAFRTVSSYKIGANCPSANNFLWLSYETFFENGHYVNGRYVDWTNDEKFKGVAELDAHTLIHETGHAMGAEDYYTEASGDSPAAGAFLMMADNVGDHDPWSKTFYGWTNPTVVLDDCEITLDKFQTNGDCLLIPCKGAWSYDGETNSIIDEFIMVEYWSPDGLNEFDCKNRYQGNSFYPQGPDAEGIKLWHVDARLGSYVRNKDGEYKFKRYETALLHIDDGFVYLAHKNDKDDQKKYGCNSFKLLETMRKDLQPAKAGQYFSEDNLWFTGESFEGINFVMHNEMNFGFNIKVNSIENGKASLSITSK